MQFYLNSSCRWIRSIPFGMKLMGEGLENAAGDKLKSILEKVTKNPISAVLVGAFVTNGNTKFKCHYGNGSWIC